MYSASKQVGVAADGPVASSSLVRVAHTRWVMSRELEDVFKSFCAFGAKDSSPLMDNAKFSKLCRDTRILDKKLTSTDVDIIFSRVKAKTERKINFEQFMVAVQYLAEIKYPGDASGTSKLAAQMAGGQGPTAHGATKAASNESVGRMTDTSLYTGSHKRRFDEDGKGRGLEGRDSVAKGKGKVPGSVSGAPSYVSGYKQEGSYSSSPKSSPKPKTKASDIVDRLTDTSKYTGSHKQRFDESGRGRGLEGRDTGGMGAGTGTDSVAGCVGYVSGYKHEGTYGKK